MSTATKAITYGNTLIPYTQRFTRRRDTIAITVGPDSRVSVAAPHATDDLVIDQAVRRKAVWILERWDEQRLRSSRIPRAFVGGESFRYLGRGYKLRVIGGAHASLRLLGGRFEAVVDSEHIAQERASTLRALFEEWYRARGHEYLPPIAEQFAKEVGVDLPPIKVVSMRTRWGSCSPRSIRFDWRVMMAPRRLVRYVVAHEICHLRHADHSRSFWRLVERLLPDYAQRHAELSTTGPRLSL